MAHLIDPPEELNNMQQDFSSMPPCLERSLTCLLFYISSRLNDGQQPINHDVRTPDQIDVEIGKELESLHEQLKIEELNSKENDSSLATASICIKNNNWAVAASELTKILRRVRPLDIHELTRLVRCVDEAADLIKNKDIILLMGFTGSGKSTMSHFLAGSKMVQVVGDEGCEIIPTEVKNPDLAKVIISGRARSETRFITPVTIDYSDIGAYTQGTVILCDSPGFGDTAGAEVDIANGVGIIRAIKKCNSVKPVVLFSYKRIGDRCEGVKELAHILAGLIPSVHKHLAAFSYVFTKYPEHEGKVINNTLLKVNRDLNEEEKSDTGFTDVLKDMLKKTRRAAQTLDPLKDDPGVMLDELAESSTIKRPDEVFELSITPKSKAVVQQQIQIIQLSILSASQRSDYLLVKYRLDQLKSLCNLLPGDLTEQVYTECIRQITKHLSNEYQNSISMFDRCLTNQTILTVEDIQRYQTCISHFKLVESLRNDHLGNTIVHSSAFITHLNQQIENIRTSLKETDIDDPIVKINLDKIKLVSNYFPNIVEKYQEVCQLFLKKLQLVVSSFKNSVLTNKFDESATNIKKFHDACTNLHDHLNSEHMQATYVDLQKYFLDYIDSNVQRMNDILTKNTLEKTDIDNLNTCVCIFESIANIFTLEPHVSLKKIDEIYKKFLAQIIKYFDEIVNKIDVQCKKENSFHTLEQYMKQLDLIRSIPIINTATSESYWKTLEQLIGSIQRSKSSVDEQLRMLVQQGEKINCNELMKCLSDLKGAQWIENYRSGIYTDVINTVEQQLNHHITTVQDSLVIINLDLDNVDKIEYVYKKILNINQMKPIENIIGNISETIENVNSWFKGAIDNVFKTIKTTFDIETWENQSWPTFDFSKAEKAFTYLYTCRNIQILMQSDCVTVLNNLEKFVRDYSTFIEKEINNCFQTIKQFENGNKEDTFTKARVLAKRLREITDLQTNYRQIFSSFANKKILEYWKEELVDNLNELADEMEVLRRNQRIETLNDKLVIIKAFSRIDWFLEEGSKYLALYQKHQAAIFSQTDDTCKQVLDAIAKNDFQQVAHELKILELSNDVGERFVKQAKRALIIGLENLMEVTKNRAISLGNDIEKEQILSIVENLKHLQRAKQFVSDYVNIEEIEKCISEVSQWIEERVGNFVKTIQAAMAYNRFSEADSKIERLQLIRNIFKNYCTANMAKQINDLQDSGPKAILRDVVKRYSEMDLNMYSFYPPIDIFKQFEEVSMTNAIYNEALENIKRNILSRFRQELELAKAYKPPDIQNGHIRNFESAIEYVPEMMKKTLQDELQRCLDFIISDVQDNKTKLETTLQSNDLDVILTVLGEYENTKGMKFYANRIKENVRKHVQTLVKKIIHHFDNYEVLQALNVSSELHNYKIKLEKYITDMEQSLETVRIRIKAVFQDEYELFKNGFLHNYKSDISGQVVNKVEKSFNCLYDFMKFYFEQQYQPISTDLLPENIGEKITKMNENILRHLNEQQNKIDNALEQLDAEILKDSLDKLSKWDSVIGAMKNYEQIHSIDDSAVVKLANTVRELKTYSQMLKLISQLIKKLHKELIDQELINKETEQYEKQRNAFYQQLSKKLLFLQKTKSLFSTYELDIDIASIEQDCIRSLKKIISTICMKAKRLIDKFLSNSIWTEDDSKCFNVSYNNMLSFREIMTIKSIDINEDIDYIREKFFSQIQIWEQSAAIENNIQNIANYLISMKGISNKFPAFTKEVEDRIDNVLKICKSRNSSPINIGRLGAILQRDETGIGSNIISEHKAFEGYSISIFHKNTEGCDLTYIVKKLSGDEINTYLLEKRYVEFHTTYETIIKQYLKSNMDLTQLKCDTLTMSGNVKLESDSSTWNTEITTAIPAIVANIFALWTLQNAESYFEAAGLDGQNDYLRQPHEAQVISIFRMLGIGQKDEQLENNLVQLQTGEGKSIILGVTAVTLALLGFDVSCACYSEYLSNRDYTAFSPLFESFGLTEYIHYGTFNKLCEAIINENGSIRKRVEQFILKDSNDVPQISQQRKCPKILLIDEVDVFFSQEFYGNVYSPSAYLKDPTITALIELIWEGQESKSKLNLKSIAKTAEYEACCNRFPNWRLLINEAIKSLISDVKNFQAHTYVVKQDKIGYVEHDNIVYNVTYGYKTLFAYYSEYKKGNISRESLDENIGIIIRCGSFSYAEMPHNFKYIIGVSGTLKHLSNQQSSVIRNKYKIKKNTFVPSIFGENKLRFVEKDDIKLEDDSNYFNVVRREIDDQLIGRSGEKRAVLVVFESLSKLKEFYESKALEPIKGSVSYLTEEASSQEKDYLIKRATTSGQVMLITRKFGRGTDFVCHDQKLSANGGVHVIQTFLSEEVSEEVQIKGRTARQANNGSYSLILNYRDLEKFNIKKEDIDDIKKGKGILVRLINVLTREKNYDTVYQYLNDKRTDLFVTHYQDNMKYVKQAQMRHVATKDFLQNLSLGNASFVQMFLVEENKAASDLNSRTICLMDATGSMAHLLHKCKTTVDIMVQRASEILKDYDIDPNSFQIQFVFYRNYNSRAEKILQASSWETQPDNLRVFTNTIEVEGGWNNEAIEIGLWHANNEHKREPITQVILIGDAPPNEEHEVKKKRKHFGENYWKTTKFAQEAYYKKELAKLKSDDIPIHAFYVNQKAEAVFRTMANETNGRCEFLDINSLTGSEILTDLVTEEILRSTGGDTKGNELVKAYREKFGKSYT